LAGQRSETFTARLTLLLLAVVRQALADAGTSTAPAPAGPAAPSHFAATATSSSAVDLSWWDMSNNETGFQVERKTGAAGTWSRIATKGANVSIHDDYTVAPGRLYSYRVRAVNANGASAWTNEISATAP